MHGSDPPRSGPTSGRPFFLAAYGLLGAALVVLVLRDQARPFQGEDWLESVLNVLTRVGHFDGGVSLDRALHPRNLFASSYGPVYYLYELVRMAPFGLGLPFHELTFRYVLGLCAVACAGLTIVALRSHWAPHQALAFLLILAFSPESILYFRTYGAMTIVLVQVLSLVTFLGFLRHGTPGRLALFYVAAFLALSTVVTSVNDMIGYVVLLAAFSWLRGRVATDGVDALAARGVWALFFGTWRRRLAFAAWVASVAAVVAYNYSNFHGMTQANYGSQGVYSHIFKRMASGELAPFVNLAVMTAEAWATLPPVFFVLLPIALWNVATTRRLTPLTVVMLAVFALDVAECALLVPTRELFYAYRALLYTLPLWLIVADNAGAALAREWWGAPVLAGAVIATPFAAGLRPVADVRSVLEAQIPSDPYKALGYVFRHERVDERVATCLGADSGLHGGQLFYINRLPARDVFADSTHGAAFCGLLIDDPRALRAARVQKVLAKSDLSRSVTVVDGNRVLLDFRTTASIRGDIGAPERIDVHEYSRRFSSEFHTLAALFPPRR